MKKKKVSIVAVLVRKDRGDNGRAESTRPASRMRIYGTAAECDCARAEYCSPVTRDAKKFKQKAVRNCRPSRAVCARATVAAVVVALSAEVNKRACRWRRRRPIALRRATADGRAYNSSLAAHLRSRRAHRASVRGGGAQCPVEFTSAAPVASTHRTIDAEHPTGPPAGLA